MKVIKSGTFAGAAWAGPQYPNMSTPAGGLIQFSQRCQRGCLYNVTQDPSEYHDLAATNPDMLNMMLARLQALSTTIWNKTNDKVDPACEATAKTRYGNFYGPWLELN